MSSDSPKAECTPTQPKPTTPNANAEEIEAVRQECKSRREEFDFVNRQYGRLNRTENPSEESLKVLAERVNRHYQLVLQSEQIVKNLEEATSRQNE